MSEFPTTTKKAIAAAFCDTCPTRAKDESSFFHGTVCYDKRFPGNENCLTLMNLENLTPEQLSEYMKGNTQ